MLEDVLLLLPTAAPAVLGLAGGGPAARPCAMSCATVATREVYECGIEMIQGQVSAKLKGASLLWWLWWPCCGGGSWCRGAAMLGSVSHEFIHQGFDTPSGLAASEPGLSL